MKRDAYTFGGATLMVALSCIMDFMLRSNTLRAL
jgi:hypothetical protein